jgi:hypothetical protein
VTTVKTAARGIVSTRKTRSSAAKEDRQKAFDGRRAVQSPGRHAAFPQSPQENRLEAVVNRAFPEKRHTTESERTTALNATHLSGGQHCECIFGEMAPVKLGSPTIPIYFSKSA